MLDISCIVYDIVTDMRSQFGYFGRRGTGGREEKKKSWKIYGLAVVGVAGV